MMRSADQQYAAEVLLSAYRSRIAVAPLTDGHPGMSVADAYGVQLAQLEAWQAAGARVAGHKIGLTSLAIRQQLGVFEPDYGHLLDSMFFPEHTPIPADQFLQPRIEPELAFVLRKPLRGPGVTAAEALTAVDFVLPALEIIDSRIADWRITLADTIADNASSGAVVLGSKPTALSAVDLRLTGCTLHHNGALAATGAGGAVLGSPVNSLVWLANTLAGRGVELEAGQVVLSGALTAAAAAAPGDTFTANFGGIGSVTATFASTKAKRTADEGARE
ncbi:2-keto-4-pentenoate hydratase [Nocardia sp. Marseille-Q1738]